MKSLLSAAILSLLVFPVGIFAQAPDRPANTAPGASPGTGGQGGSTRPMGLTVGSDGPVPPASPQFGAWLDDASLEGRGTARVSLGAGYWRTPDGRQLDVPMIDTGYDLSDRIHVAAFVPFFRATYSGELTTGVDDVYLSTKIIVVNGANAGGRFGVAVSPSLEVLNSGFTTGNRVHWVIPLSAEFRAKPSLRIYGAGGYFSRGAVFGGVAAEWSAPTASVVWAALTHSYALETGTSFDGSLSRQLANVAVGLTQLVNERLAVYANIGRTISDTRSGSPTIGVGGGISIRLASAKAAP